MYNNNMELLAKIGTILLAPIIAIIAIGGFLGFGSEEPVVQNDPVVVVEEYDASVLLDRIAELESQELGAQNAVGGKKYFLSGSGVSATQDSLTLTNFDIAGSETDLSMADFGDLGCGTLEPGHSTRQEFISFTGVTQNSDNTAKLTGVIRGLLPVPDYSASSTFENAHAGGSSFVISNSPPCFYEDYGSLSNSENITGAWTTITPTAAAGIATKNYVDGIVTGGSVTLDGIALGSTAGETFATGTIVFFDDQQDEWMKASALVFASSTGIQLGIAQGAGTNGAAISGGVLTKGYDETQVGGTAGQTIYLSDTAGATSTSAGTIRVILGQMRTATVFYFDPIYGNIVHLAADNNFLGENTFNASSTFNSTSTFVGDAVGTGIVEIYTASTTWTKPNYGNFIRVIAIGAGGGGGGGTRGSNQVGAGGGGAGGYSEAIFRISELGATETITIGSGGAGGAGKTSPDGAGGTGTTGSNTTFGSFLLASGGTGGASAQTAGTGGTGTVVTGGAGGAGGTSSGVGTAAASTEYFAPTGGGGGGGSGSNGAAGGAKTLITQIGGAAGTAGDGGDGVVLFSTVGGTGGGGGEGIDGSTAGSGGDGAVYGAGGGGGGASTATGGDGGAGSNGFVIIFVY